MTEIPEDGTFRYPNSDETIKDYVDKLMKFYNLNLEQASQISAAIVTQVTQGPDFVPGG